MKRKEKREEGGNLPVYILTSLALVELISQSRPGAALQAWQPTRGVWGARGGISNFTTHYSRVRSVRSFHNEPLVLIRKQSLVVVYGIRDSSSEFCAREYSARLTLRCANTSDTLDSLNLVSLCRPSE